MTLSLNGVGFKFPLDEIIKGFSYHTKKNNCSKLTLKFGEDATAKHQTEKSSVIRKCENIIYYFGDPYRVS